MKTIEVQARATKPSGIPWLGEVPAHWEVKRLAHFGEFRKGRGIARADITDEGVPAILYGDLYTQYELKAETLVKRTTPEVAANAEEIRTGDLLLTGSGETKEDIGRCIVYLGKEKAYAGGDVIILRQSKADSLYLSYVLNSAPVVAQKTQMAKGEIVVHIYSSDLRDIVFPLPPLPEQRAIAAFLDERTARIDALVARKWRLVQLLKEKRQALITRAVTRGLDPKVKMKESGVPWLGEVPEHWEVKRLKDIADVRFSNVDKKTEEGEIPVRLCNYTDVYYGHYLDGTPEYMEATATRSEIERFKLRKGDVLITKDSESPTDIAIAAMVVEDVPDLVCGYHLAMIRADRDKLEPAFLYWQFLSDQVREQYYPLANGITRFALGHGEINGGAFVLPPLPEQRAIAAFLDDRTARIDNLITKIEQAVERLQEYRTALISAAVTGKVRIPMGRSEDQMIGQ
jgi:type I restriction enzyme S subunit